MINFIFDDYFGYPNRNMISRITIAASFCLIPLFNLSLNPYI